MEPELRMKGLLHIALETLNVQVLGRLKFAQVASVADVTLMQSPQFWESTI